MTPRPRPAIILLLAIASGAAGADDAQVHAFLALGGKRTAAAIPSYDLGSMFDTDSGVFSLASIPTAFAGPRVIAGIERSCSCLEATAICPDSRGALVPPNAALAISGRIQLPPLPGRYQSDLTLRFAAPSGGAPRDDLRVPLTYQVRASLILDPELPAVLMLDRGEACRWSARLAPQRPIALVTAGASGIAGYQAEVAEGRLAIAGPALALGSYELHLAIDLDGRTLKRNLRVVCKHPLLSADSFPAGLVGRSGELRLPLGRMAGALPAITVQPGSRRGLLGDLRLRSGTDALVLAFACRAPPGPFHDVVVLAIAEEAVPIHIFGVAE